MIFNIKVKIELTDHDFDEEIKEVEIKASDIGQLAFDQIKRLIPRNERIRGHNLVEMEVIDESED